MTENIWIEIIKIAPSTILILGGLLITFWVIKKINIRKILEDRQIIKVSASGIEVLLEKANLSPAQRKELSGLSANEVWALETFYLII